MEVLFVCTGNVCRSPMAEVLLAARLGGSGSEPVTVRSAGLVSQGAPAHPDAVRVLAERGLDVSTHCSQRVSPALIAQADLVIGMAREHVREVVVLEPGAWTRTFTLRELVRRAAGIAPRQGAEPLSNWLAGLGDGRRLGDLVGEDPADDVADPMAAEIEVFRATADALEGLIDELVRRAWPDRANLVQRSAGVEGRT